MLTAGRVRLLVALAILTPLLLWWGFAGNNLPQEKTLRQDTDTSIDFFMRDAETRYWGEDGSFQRSWTTPELRHYPRLNSSKLLEPSTLMPQDKGGAYKIRANEGWVLDDQSEIQLAGDVEVNHNPLSGPGSVLTTSTLSVYPPRDYAETDAPATLIREDERTETTGLEVYFDERRVELLSNVKGRYNAP
ncbi:LPS export ABC transporter periplasmic protein LptC [Marinobacterium sp. YM272]|uniref:LPS export ABC transporter periplasmic protein LptC n=1 Tax=Marinobacterium sp. YM272 TaxID=3421654 RepID=UPI003D7F25C6